VKKHHGTQPGFILAALVDSGALHMAINKNIQEILQLPVVGKEKAQLAKWPDRSL